MRFSTILVFISLALTGFAAPNAKRTVAQVEADIAKISAQVTTLDNATLAFPNTGGTLVQALTIQTDFTTIITNINTGITDIKATPTPIAESDGQAILMAIQNLEPGIIKFLQDIATKKAAFAALPSGISAAICQDLRNFQMGTDTLLSIFTASVSPDLAAPAFVIKGGIDDAFTAALAALGC